ncbi:hypothetical protein [Endothiovibrio diazotrophicus]
MASPPAVVEQPDAPEEADAQARADLGRGVVDRAKEPQVSADLAEKYSRQMWGEVAVFAQMGIAVLALVGFLVFLGLSYIDNLFNIDFTELGLENLNDFFRLFVILVLGALNVHLIHQIMRFLGRRVLVMGLLKELNDALGGEGEVLWKLRPILWAEGNKAVVEQEAAFLSLRNGIELAYKSLLGVQTNLVGILQATKTKHDIHPHMEPLKESLEIAERRLRVLRYPFFRDAGYSLGVSFYSRFRAEVDAMLQEISRLMNQFENMAMVEEERKLERERTRRLELDRQHKINEFSLESHLDIFLKRIEELTPTRLRGKSHTKFLALYNALKQKFVTAQLLPPERLARIGEEVNRINQIEDIISFYDEKIRMVKNDSVDLTERRDKARYWTQLRDQHIAELRRKSVESIRGGGAGGDGNAAPPVAGGGA